MVVGSEHYSETKYTKGEKEFLPSLSNMSSICHGMNIVKFAV